ncbi:MAG: hypothetical protein ACRDU5_07085 [Mycobacterium sp.]
MARQGRRAAELCSSGRRRFTIGYGQVAAKISEGDFAGADAICQQPMAMAAGEPQAQDIVTQGRLLVFRGRLVEASAMLRRALATVRGAGPQGWGDGRGEQLSASSGRISGTPLMSCGFNDLRPQRRPDQPPHHSGGPACPFRFEAAGCRDS